MSPDIIEEWYHVKMGKESPISAKGLSPSAYLTKVFGDAKFLPELQKYEQAVKFKKSGKWADVASGALRVVGGVVVRFLPWAGWVLLGAAELLKLFAK